MNKSLIENITKSVLKRLQENNEKIYDTPNLKLAELFEMAIQSEAQARKEYYQLLQNVTNPEHIASIQEIVKDEIEHSEKLKGMLKSYSKIPATKD